MREMLGLVVLSAFAVHCAAVSLSPGYASRVAPPLFLLADGR